MNNSVTHPQVGVISRGGVENRGFASTGVMAHNPLLTRPFANSSTIHTPYYYDYQSSFKTRAVREEGTSCAYPS